MRALQTEGGCWRPRAVAPAQRDWPERSRSSRPDDDAGARRPHDRTGARSRWNGRRAGERGEPERRRSPGSCTRAGDRPLRSREILRGARAVRLIWNRRPRRRGRRFWKGSPSRRRLCHHQRGNQREPWPCCCAPRGSSRAMLRPPGVDTRALRELAGTRPSASGSAELDLAEFLADEKNGRALLWSLPRSSNRPRLVGRLTTVSRPSVEARRPRPPRPSAAAVPRRRADDEEVVHYLVPLPDSHADLPVVRRVEWIGEWPASSRVHWRSAPDLDQICVCELVTVTWILNLYQCC